MDREYAEYACNADPREQFQARSKEDIRFYISLTDKLVTKGDVRMWMRDLKKNGEVILEV